MQRLAIILLPLSILAAIVARMGFMKSVLSMSAFLLVAVCGLVCVVVVKKICK